MKNTDIDDADETFNGQYFRCPNVTHMHTSACIASKLNIVLETPPNYPSHCVTVSKRIFILSNTFHRLAGTWLEIFFSCYHRYNIPKGTTWWGVLSTRGVGG